MHTPTHSLPAGEPVCGWCRDSGVLVVESHKTNVTTSEIERSFRARTPNDILV